MHFSYQNMCSNCNTCIHIADYIEALALTCNNEQIPMDVFFEFPYVPKKSHPERSAILSRLTDLFKNDTGVNKFLSKVGVFNVAVIGIFSELYRKFKKQVYDHDRQPSCVHFHYGDIRKESNIIRVFNDTCSSSASFLSMQTRIATTDRLRELINSFLFSDNFAASISDLMGPDFAVDSTTLSSDGKHRIAKQFDKLSAQLKGPIKEYIDAYVDVIIDDVSKHAHYNEATEIYRRIIDSKPKDHTHHMSIWDQLIKHDDKVLSLYAELICVSYMLIVCMVMMDVYLVCRMMFYASRHDKEGIIVIYTGDAHTKHYVDFLVNFLGATPKSCSDGYIGEADIETMTTKEYTKAEADITKASRCIPINTQTCSKNILARQNVKSHRRS